MSTHIREQDNIDETVDHNSSESRNSQYLDSVQKRALENFYTKVAKLPKRQAKTELSKKYNIDPFALNKWFQSRRNKDPEYEAQRKTKGGRITKVKKTPVK